MLNRYLEESSVHGLRYLSEGKSRLLKLLWLICILASFFVAGFNIYQSLVQWNETPTMLSSVKSVVIEVRYYGNSIHAGPMCGKLTPYLGS